jgi:hypothetical protein
MLGSVLFDKRRELYDSCIPAWEKENRDWNKKNVAVPYDLPQMYTQQARRMYVVDEDGHVPGIYVSAGEVYSENLLFMNPAFAVNREEKKDPTPPVPIRCPDSPDIWKAIAFIAGPESSGVREWVGVLAGDDIFEEDRVIPFRATGIRYGASCCSVEKIIEDNIVMNRAFIRETERQIEAVNAINDIEKISDCVYMFGKNCSQCMGFDKKYKKIAEDLKKQYSNTAGKKVLQFAAGKTTANDLQKAKSEKAFIEIKELITVSVKMDDDHEKVVETENEANHILKNQERETQDYLEATNILIEDINDNTSKQKNIERVSNIINEQKKAKELEEKQKEIEQKERSE